MHIMGGVLRIGFLGVCLTGVAIAQDSGPARRPARISGGVMAGQLLTKAQPVYPEQAKAEKVQGAVVLHAIIGKNGMIENVSVITGPEMLQRSAIDAVRQWVYKPYLLNGEPTEVDTTITVNYSLGLPEPDGGGQIVNGTASGPGYVMPPGTVRISGGIMAGQLIAESKVQPEYPVEAKEKGISGMVVVGVTVGPDGKVETLKSITGPEELRGAAEEAVRQWRYKPYMLNGEVVRVQTTVTVNFSLPRS